VRILLVNAPTPGYTLQPYPPLQLGYLAAAVRDTGRHEADILDLAVLDRTDAQIMAAMAGFDAVGVYFVTLNHGEAMRLCALAKQVGCVTMAGGPHAGLVPEETVAHGDLDFAFISEAELSLVELMDTMADGGSPLTVQGLTVATSFGPMRTPPRSDRPDLRRLSWPARDLIPMSRYLARTTDTSLVASRGCPYPCSFCSIRIMSAATYRRRDPADVISEAQHLVARYPVSRLTFFDDIFTIHPGYTTRLLEEMHDRPLGVEWSCETRVDRIYPELLTTMRATGCWRIFYGVESGSQRILDSMAKGTTVAQIETAVRQTQAAGITPVLSVMVGVPEDDEASIRETISLVKRLEPNEVWFQPFAPFPGTDIVSQIPDLLGQEWLSLYRQLDLRTPVLPTRHLGLRQVKDLFLEAMLTTAGTGWVKPAQAAHPAPV
jgi:radical SAM superfamily enzyme YgiQ (UPF0313 family)